MAVFCSELPKEWSQPHHTAPRQSASLRNPKSNTLLEPKIQDTVGGREGTGSHSPKGRRPFSLLSSRKRSKHCSFHAALRSPRGYKGFSYVAKFEFGSPVPYPTSMS